MNKIDKQWYKTHVICGVRINTVIDIKIGTYYINDSRYLLGLVMSTAERFHMIKRILNLKSNIQKEQEFINGNLLSSRHLILTKTFIRELV